MVKRVCGGFYVKFRMGEFWYDFAEKKNVLAASAQMGKESGDSIVFRMYSN
ncbi:MAG: hypothetical protein Ct9H300mP28_14860 [Pseudomonadota bacterium]|nr:MAG: hypothetical protein Ct9H300mP28_14860 [Pseudomonadota bacterium]